MTTEITTGCLQGTRSLPVLVTATTVEGPAGFSINGLAEPAMKEARVRVLSSIANSAHPLHVTNRCTVDVTGESLRGGCFDLPIAVAVLVENGAMHAELDTMYFGELALDGRLRQTRGALAFMRMARAAGARRVVVGQSSARFARFVPGLEVRTAGSLTDVIEGRTSAITVEGEADRPFPGMPDLSELRGLEQAKALLEAAAIDGLNVLIIGPPGAGKTMLARRLPGLLPTPTEEERLELATIADAAGFAGTSETLQRPFRAPHHTASTAALVGGGNPVRPGEVTLAHGGVLFLDEVNEFRRESLEMLASVLRKQVVTVVHGDKRIEMPACAQVVAAMNPCPCAQRECHCTDLAIQRHHARIDAIRPLFHIVITLGHNTNAELTSGPIGESSATVRARVEQLRAMREAV